MITMRSFLRLYATSILLAPALAVSRLVSSFSRWHFTRHNTVERALRELGLLGPGETLEKNAVEVIRGGHANVLVRVNREEGPIVLKRTLAHGSLVALSGIWGLAMPIGAVRGNDRAGREVATLKRLREAGVRAPELLGAAPHLGLRALEWIDGVPLGRRTADPKVVARFGAALRRAHDAGITLCDAHLGNALVDDSGEVILLDFDYATVEEVAQEDRRAFDLAYALAFSPNAASRRALCLGYGPIPSELRGKMEVVRGRLRAFAPFIWLERLAWSSHGPSSSQGSSPKTSTRAEGA